MFSVALRLSSTIVTSEIPNQDYSGKCNWIIDDFGLFLPMIPDVCSGVYLSGGGAVSVITTCSSDGLSATITLYGYENPNCDNSSTDGIYTWSASDGEFYCNATNNGDDCDMIILTTSFYNDSRECDSDNGAPKSAIAYLASGFEDGICLRTHFKLTVTDEYYAADWFESNSNCTGDITSAWGDTEGCTPDDDEDNNYSSLYQFEYSNKMETTQMDMDNSNQGIRILSWGKYAKITCFCCFIVQLIVQNQF